MTDEQIASLSMEDLHRLLKRANFVKEQMAGRVAALLQENLELMGVIQELQEDLQRSRAISNGEVTTPEVPADVTS